MLRWGVYASLGSPCWDPSGGFDPRSVCDLSDREWRSEACGAPPSSAPQENHIPTSVHGSSEVLHSQGQLRHVSVGFA